MTRETIKLPRSSYEELRKIIAAYGKVPQPSGLDEISVRTGMHRSRISDNNAFLAAIGLIEGGKLKGPTSRGQELALALEHEIPDEVARAWAAVVRESEFLNKILQAIVIRKGMETSQLETHVAYSAGESKTDAVMTGARAVVDILKASGLVREDDGKIIPAASPPATPQEQQRAGATTAFVAAFPTPGPAHQAQITIRININASPAELEGLPQKIRDFMDSLSDLFPRNQLPPTIG